MKKFITYVFPFSLILVIIVNYIFDQPEFKSLQEELKYYKTLNDLPQQKKTYKLLLEEDPYNIDYHYYFIQTHFNLPKSNQPYDGDYLNYRNDNELINHYNKLSKSINSKEKE